MAKTAVSCLAASSGTTDTYTVPAGKYLVAKFSMCHPGSSGQSSMTVGGKAVVVNLGIIMSGTLVVPAGVVLSANTSVSGSVLCSGFLYDP